jgi:acyl carrier protein
MDDLGGDEFDIVDVFVQIESKLGISIPEEETFDIMTVSALCEVVERHVQPN